MTALALQCLSVCWAVPFCPLVSTSPALGSTTLVLVGIVLTPFLLTSIQPLFLLALAVVCGLLHLVRQAVSWRSVAIPLFCPLPVLWLFSLNCLPGP